MRYEHLISTNLALLDQPRTKNDREHYLEKIFKRLLIYDQMPDEDLRLVISEAESALRIPNPSFDILFHNDFERYIETKRYIHQWQKIRQDFGYYVDGETKRRNKENPYHNNYVADVASWDKLPDIKKHKPHQNWQYDSLYRDAEALVNSVKEQFGSTSDRDHFRVKINSILTVDKIIFALNSSENIYDFVDSEISTMNIKLSLDAFKLAHTFLNRAIDSLHKVSWSSKNIHIAELIMASEKLLEKLKLRVFEFERRFMLYIQPDNKEDGIL